MDAGTPLITLVKKAEIGPKPALTNESLALEQTLSMLCSFLSVEDFISFLSSTAFQSYAQHQETWLSMEIGLYIDHTKTLQLYPEQHGLIIADDAMTGAFEEDVWKGQANESLVRALQHWIDVVTSSGV